MAAVEVAAETVFAELFCRQAGDPQDKETRVTLTSNKTQVVIGRDANCDFPVKCSKISKEHLLLRWLESGVVQMSVPGTSGCYVNNKHLEKDSNQKLQDGDRIAVGKKQKNSDMKEPHCSLRIVLPAPYEETAPKEEESPTNRMAASVEDVALGLPKEEEVRAPMTPPAALADLGLSDVRLEQPASDMQVEEVEEAPKASVDGDKMPDQSARSTEEATPRPAPTFNSLASGGPWPKVAGRCTLSPTKIAQEVHNPPEEPPAPWRMPQSVPPPPPESEAPKTPPTSKGRPTPKAMPITPVKPGTQPPRIIPSHDGISPASPNSKRGLPIPGPPPGPPPPSPTCSKPGVPEPAEPPKSVKQECNNWDPWNNQDVNSWNGWQGGWQEAAWNDTCQPGQTSNGWGWPTYEWPQPNLAEFEALGLKPPPKVPDTPPVAQSWNELDGMRPMAQRSRSCARGRSRTPARGGRSPSRGRSVARSRSVGREPSAAAPGACPGDSAPTKDEEAVSKVVQVLATALGLDLSATHAIRSMPLEQVADAAHQAVGTPNPSKIVHQYWREHREKNQDRSLDDDAHNALLSLPPEETQQLFKKLPTTQNPSAFVMGWVRRYKQQQMQQQSPPKPESNQCWWGNW